MNSNKKDNQGFTNQQLSLSIALLIGILSIGVYITFFKDPFPRYIKEAKKLRADIQQTGQLAPQNTYDRVILDLNKVLETQPDNLELYQILADLYHSYGDIKRLKNICERGIVADPLNADLHLKLTNVYAELKDLNMAIITAEKILTFDSNNFDAILSLGVLYHKINDRDNAKYYLNRALIIRPDLPRARQLLRSLEEDFGGF